MSLEEITQSTAKSPSDLIDLEESLDTLGASASEQVQWAFRGQPRTYGTLCSTMAFPRVFSIGLLASGTLSTLPAQAIQTKMPSCGSMTVDTPNYARFAECANEYSGLLRNHIQKENHALFPTADKTLTNTQLEQLYESFEEHEEKVIGQGRHEELHEMLKGLKWKYAT